MNEEAELLPGHADLLYPGRLARAAPWLRRSFQDRADFRSALFVEQRSIVSGLFRLVRRVA